MDSNQQNPADERIAFVAKAAQNRLLNFAQFIDPKYETHWFHELIAEKLEGILERVKRKEKVRVILALPPRAGKSRLASIMFSAWALGKYPELKFIISTYGAELSEKIGLATRDLMNDEKYKVVFPDIQLRPDVKAKAKWMTNKGGSFTGVGIGTAVTGIGADIITIDDPHKDRAEAESQTVRESVWEYYRSTLYSRLEGYGAVIVIMQRWHQDDLVGRLLAESEKLKGTDEPRDDWEVINFPAIAEQDEYDEKGNLLRKQGEALWPTKFPLPVLNNIRATQGVYNWSCTPAETPILMEDWKCKPISEIKAGDTLVGFIHGTKKTKRSLTRAKVKNVFSKIGDVYDIEMESGRKIRCTLDHKWFTGRTEADKTHDIYSPAYVGGKLMYVCPTNDDCTEEERLEWRYFAGLVDGEGHIGRACLALHQSPAANPEVFERMLYTINKLGLSYKMYRWQHKNIKWKESACFNIRDIKNVYRKLIRIGDAAKLSQLVGRLFESSHGFVREKDRVKSITFSKRERVYALETETGNYIAWGYASSNSQYQQDPILAENQEFKQHYFKYFNEEDLKGKYLRYYTLVDPAISQKKSADNSVVLTVAKEVNGPNFYRVREDAGHYTPQQLVDLILVHQNEYGGTVHIETIAYQEALKYLVLEEQRKREKYFLVYEVKARAAKEERIRGLLGLYQAGVIHHRQSDVEYERELLAFPRGRRDDRIDVMSMLLSQAANTGRVRANQHIPRWKGYGRKA